MSEMHLRVTLVEPLAIAVPAQGGAVGRHRVRGALLLGAVARARYDGLDAMARRRVFHSGQVRLSDALPGAGDGTLAAPWPSTLRVADDASGASPRAFNLARLTAAAVATRHPDMKLRRQAGFLGGEAEPRRRQLGVEHTLRTRLDERGRAEEGMLYRIDTLPPGTTLWTQVQAEREADLELVEEALVGADVMLGRSRGAEMGRVRVERVDTGPTVTPAQRAPAADPDGRWRVVVWCVSDVALLHGDTGAPRLRPTPADIGLPPEHWRIDEASSALEPVRYSPFHGYRSRWDTERVALAAGGVWTFVGEEAPPIESLRAHVAAGLGLYREGGFGRVFIEPSRLRSASLDGEPVRDAEPSAAHSASRVEPPGELWLWARARQREAEAHEPLDGISRRAERRLSEFAPTASQWSKVVDLATECAAGPEPMSALRAGLKKRWRENATTQKMWLQDRVGKLTASAALLEHLAEIEATRAPGAAQVRAVASLAKRVVRYRHAHPGGASW